MFHLVGLDASGQIVVRKRCSRTQLLTFTAIQAEIIGMEACSGSHFLGKALRAQGHDFPVRSAGEKHRWQWVPPTLSKPDNVKGLFETVQIIGTRASGYPTWPGVADDST